MPGQCTSHIQIHYAISFADSFCAIRSGFRLAQELLHCIGFSRSREAADYAGFGTAGCSFMLQEFDRKEFAEQFMLTVATPSADEFWKEVNHKKLPEKFGIRVSKPALLPYRKEVNIMDMAGLCWHFVEG